MQNTKGLFWTEMEHPPYKPDLSPCDHHMFASLKQELEGHKVDETAVEKLVQS